MKVKTLLLGSAAAFAVVGGAQAADLTIAEPVDYVRVCDAFGTGYWYLPGTDTCIKVGGEVTFDINFHALTSILDGGEDGHEELGTGTGFQGDFDENNSYTSNHSANWDFQTGAKISLTGKSQTELGDLIGTVTITASSNNATQPTITSWYVDHSGNNGPEDVDIYYTYSQVDVDRIFKIDEAYLQLNWLSAGYRDSTFQYSGGYAGATTYRGNKKTDQIRVTWAMGGFSLMLAAEDPRDRWGTSMGGITNMPDLIAAITWAQGSWDGKLSFGFAGPIANAPFFYGNVWGVNLGMTFGITENDDLRLNVAAGTGSTFVSSSDATNGLMNVSAFASWQHAWTPEVSSALTAAALWTEGSLVKYAISGGLVWEPVSDFSVSTRVIYENEGGDPSWAGRIQLKRVIDP